MNASTTKPESPMNELLIHSVKENIEMTKEFSKNSYEGVNV